MPLPLFPIGTQPFGTSAAEASKQKGLVLFFILIIVFLGIEDEDANKCNPLLTTFLDMLVLIGVATIAAVAPTNCPCNANPPANTGPNCPANPNLPPICPGDNDSASTMVSVKSVESLREATEPEPVDEQEADELTAASEPAASS
jgi:hypothetical protein